jgi:hypothetical protein
MTLPRQILYERHALAPGEHTLRLVVRPDADGATALDRCCIEAVESGIAT